MGYHPSWTSWRFTSSRSFETDSAGPGADRVLFLPIGSIGLAPGGGTASGLERYVSFEWELVRR